MVIEKGTEFGDWILDERYNGTWHGRAHCVCVCGVSREVNVNNLLRGLSTGCGCTKARKTGERSYKHGTGYEDHRYQLWRTIKNKCMCPTHKDWRYYGGRGITMYELWVNDYPTFAAYLDQELGPRPKGFWLDRIDNDGDYVPGNLRWASPSAQARNRRSRCRTE